MRQPETLITKQDSTGDPALYMAMELSNRQWKLGFTDRRHKVRRVKVEARNLIAVHEQIGRAKGHFGLAAEASCCCSV